VDLAMFYRMLLFFYPKDFRQQFSGEMLEVFRRAACERVALRNAAIIPFLLREHVGLLTGAAQAWMCKIIPKGTFRVVSIPIFGNYFPRPTAEEAALTTAELQKRHDAGTASMIQAAANHDFATAYRHECQVGRLRTLLQRRNRSTKPQATGAA
jgi:hypothetical protein